MTTQDVAHINQMLEDMIARANQAEATTISTFAKDTINDIVDVLIDCKVDIKDWAVDNAETMHADGFLDPVNTGVQTND